MTEGFTACHRHPRRPAEQHCELCGHPICKGCALSRRWGDVAPDVRELVCRGGCRSSKGRAIPWWSTLDGVAIATILAIALWIVPRIALQYLIQDSAAGPRHSKKSEARRRARARSNAAERKRQGTEAYREALEASPLELDTAGVVAGQRYVFDRGAFEEVWTIDAVDGEGVSFRLSWSLPSGEQRDRGRARWEPPLENRALRFQVRDGAMLAPWEVPGAAFATLELRTSVTRTRYAIRDGRLAFPGAVCEEFYAEPAAGRRLLRVEHP